MDDVLAASARLADAQTQRQARYIHPPGSEVCKPHPRPHPADVSLVLTSFCLAGLTECAASTLTLRCATTISASTALV